MKKYKIEKDTVQETLLIPLYGRKLCSERFPALFTDDSAARLMAKIDYDFSALEKRSDSIVQVFGALEVAMRQSAWHTGYPYHAQTSSGCISGGKQRHFGV